MSAPTGGSTPSRFDRMSHYDQAPLHRGSSPMGCGCANKHLRAAPRPPREPPPNIRVLTGGRAGESDDRKEACEGDQAAM